MPQPALNTRSMSTITIPSHYIPYILETNPHPFYSFRGLKNQMRITIEGGLDSRSRAGFWKNDRAGVRVVRTIQLFIILFIILYIKIFIIYYSPDSITRVQKKKKKQSVYRYSCS
jgi:hypothetical protein